MRAVIFVLLAAGAAAAQWKAVEGCIMTRFAKDVSPAKAWPEHPRPQLVRQRWMNLNGLWDYAITGQEGEWRQDRVDNATFDLLLRPGVEAPPKWDGKILVPFSVEAPLSGVGRLVRPGQILWYRRTFTVPSGWQSHRVMLRFEAVDWHAAVFVNGTRVGENKGGYVPFSFDISFALKKSEPQEIMLAVWDPSNMGDQSIGKQSLPENRKGYRYTPTTGIWQTVWLEAVPACAVESLHLVPDVDNSRLLVTAAGSGDAVEVAALDGGKRVAAASGKPGETIALRIPGAKLWSPESPFLYGLTATMRAGGEVTDKADSYFGMRKIAVAADERGIPRYYLNNRLLRFQYGPLDQGYWPDGILTPPNDQAAAYDLQYLKDIACNMVRVHVKVHPARWYYHADRLGLLVWQDMVCTRRFESKITPASSAQWEDEQRRMILGLRNHPSIIQWIVFNESWGQYDTERLTRWTKGLDPSRLVTCASGWNDAAGEGDIRDIHDYSFFPSIPLLEHERKRAIVIGEFGGFDIGVPGHMWHADQAVTPVSDAIRENVREKYSSGGAWLPNYTRWLEAWRYLIGEHGLNAGVYTQITDVEHEPNGWLTYDRAISKIPVATLRALHMKLYQEPPRPLAVLLPKTGAGAQKTRFQLDRVPARAAVRVIAKGNFEVHLNGTLVRGVNTNGTRGQAGISIQPLSMAPESVLRRGENEVTVSEAGSVVELLELPPD
jgi:hypothetical protein